MKTGLRAWRSWVATAALTVCGFSPAFGKFSSQEPPQAAVQAAKQGLTRFLGQMRPESGASLGFSDGDRLEKAELGEAFKLHTILPADLQASVPGQAVEALVTETSQWYFPVTLDGEDRALLIVDRMGGSWKAVSFGQAPLARRIAESRKQWPKARGYHPRFISVPHAYEFLFSVPEQGPENLTSLMSAAGSTPAGQNPRYDRLGKAADLIETLKPRVEANIRAFSQRPDKGTGPK